MFYFFGGNILGYMFSSVVYIYFVFIFFVVLLVEFIHVHNL